MISSNILITKASADYELLDSGEGEKLERFGAFVLSRPDPQALWRKRLPQSEWKKANGAFSREAKQGDWNLRTDMPSKWQIGLGGLKFWIKPTAFKHVGIFPEQSENWKWLEERIRAWSPELEAGSKEPRAGFPELGARSQETGGVHAISPSSQLQAPSPLSSIEILNLFGYTGGATLACAKAGAKVAHVDGSKAAIAWARDNAELSGLKDKPVRWLLDDARAFVKREAKRGRKYAGVIMDPPAFGHGPEGDLWKIEDDFLPLVDDCVKLLTDKPLFFLINGYSAGYSAIAYENDLLPLKKKFGGKIEMGELTLEESKNPVASKESTDSHSSEEPSRLLPCGIFARWSV